MPNHYHFLLRQEKEEGIRKFIQRLCNSYSHYYAIRYETRGSLFRGNFKAVRVTSNEQLLHLSRYIHLVKNPKKYLFSSYLDYLGKKQFDFVEPSLVLDQFKDENSYQKFVLARRDYQRRLEKIKHLLLD